MGALALVGTRFGDALNMERVRTPQRPSSIFEVPGGPRRFRKVLGGVQGYFETPGGKEQAKTREPTILNISAPFCAVAWQEGELKRGASVGGGPLQREARGELKVRPAIVRGWIGGLRLGRFQIESTAHPPPPPSSSRPSSPSASSSSTSHHVGKEFKACVISRSGQGRRSCPSSSSCLLLTVLKLS